MNTVEVAVTLLGKGIDWMTGSRKESKIILVVDEDKVNEVSRMTILDISKISRDPKGHAKQPSYVLHSVGSHVIDPGDASIGSWLYGVKPGTRKIRGTPANEFTRSCFKLA